MAEYATLLRDHVTRTCLIDRWTGSARARRGEELILAVAAAAPVAIRVLHQQVLERGHRLCLSPHESLPVP
jgi:hypothetical protein